MLASIAIIGQKTKQRDATPGSLHYLPGQDLKGTVMRGAA